MAQCAISTAQAHWEKNAIAPIAFLSKSMFSTDWNQYAIELVTYLLVLVVYFYEFIVYMLLERNAFDSIAFFSVYLHRMCKWSLKRYEAACKVKKLLFMFLSYFFLFLYLFQSVYEQINWFEYGKIWCFILIKNWVFVLQNKYLFWKHQYCSNFFLKL